MTTLVLTYFLLAGFEVTTEARPDELAKASTPSLGRFASLKVLHESAETDDGEDSPAADRFTRGLHTKAFIVENGWDTTLYLGSANGTNPSLVVGTNVEVMAELTRKRSRVGRIDWFLGDDGLGEYLTDFEPPEEIPPPTLEEQAEKIIDTARSELMLVGLRLSCAAAGEDIWDLSVSAKHNVNVISGLKRPQFAQLCS
jgi:hypothetical protein